MEILAKLAIGLVILIHIYIVILEMLLWTKPAGRKAFAMTEEFAQNTRVLAANQGLYNGFLVAGLIWGLCTFSMSKFITLFFLVCVLIAGLFGAVTASKKILWIQAMPALIGILLTLFA
jgi:putative membrane protein